MTALFRPILYNVPRKIFFFLHGLNTISKHIDFDSYFQKSSNHRDSLGVAGSIDKARKCITLIDKSRFFTVAAGLEQNKIYLYVFMSKKALIFTQIHFVRGLRPS